MEPWRQQSIDRLERETPEARELRRLPRERKGKALWIIQVRPTPHDSQLLIAAPFDFLN